MNFEEIKNNLETKIIGIAGAGGLGSNCAVALARVGIGKLIISDFDIVEESNLNRQYFFYNQIGEKKVDALKKNINKINPEVTVEIHNIKLTAETIIDFYKNCDIIIEAFDQASQKQMIIETVLTAFPKKVLISALGIAGFGKNNIIKARKDGNLYICGDEKTEVNNEEPPLAPRVGIIANMQANVAIDILLNKNLKEL
ncbi:MAG: sulfur carrier protein ThiS adenylyltransferase ThiF [Bacteroidota bacterium]|nr:sulfur carrier protein ThiS adenylyltransferase ThiF [Bacteroidota bacterium]